MSFHRWLGSELENLNLFHFPYRRDRKLSNAQYALLTLHQKELFRTTGAFQLRERTRQNLREKYVLPNYDEENPHLLVHGLALVDREDVDGHKEQFDQSMLELKERLKKEGIRMRIHVCTYARPPENRKDEPTENQGDKTARTREKSPLEKHLGNHYAPIASEIDGHELPFYGLHSVVMRFDVLEGNASEKIEKLANVFQDWKKYSTPKYMKPPTNARYYPLRHNAPPTIVARIPEKKEDEQPKTENRWNEPELPFRRSRKPRA